MAREDMEEIKGWKRAELCMQEAYRSGFEAVNADVNAIF